jgi:hypothetical protein
VKYYPQAVDDEFTNSLRECFDDGEINELAVTSMAYSVFHHWRSALGEDVVDEDGRSLAAPEGGFGRDGFWSPHYALGAPRGT